MVDTRDLKSLGQQCPCGFDSRPRHEKTQMPKHLGLLVPDGTVFTGAHPQTPRAFARRFALLQVSLIVHLFVENTIYPDGAILVLLIKDNMMSDLKTQESRLDDIIVFLKENRQTVQSLDSGINLPIIDDRLVL